MDKQPWIIVGLGNPGGRYEKTRHNIGFMAVDFFAEKKGISFKKDNFCQASLAKSQLDGEEVILIKPLTYMNLSGEAIKKYNAFYKLNLSRLIVIVDDADLPFGELRLKASGSSGGHNGLKSLEYNLGTRDFNRLKVGIGRSNEIALVDYVLQSFSEEEQKALPNILSRITEALTVIMTEPLARAMNKINVKEKKDERREEKPL
ncbi:Peptidyl-tRNA hydrolase [Chlamydiales bacterium STE3]|nr:Peptidyl-tRNA hydrolase [Chlamydiales bacterium STE3]